MGHASGKVSIVIKSCCIFLNGEEISVFLIIVNKDSLITTTLLLLFLLIITSKI